MKTVVSRRSLSKLCYKVATMIDIVELTTSQCIISFTHYYLILLVRGEYNTNNPVDFADLFKTHEIEANIRVSKAGNEGSKEIDFRELCEAVTALKKEVELVEVEIVDGKVSIKPLTK